MKRLLLGLSCVLGCAPAAQRPEAPVAHALDATVEWSPLTPSAGRDARGREVDVVEVRGGEIVRLVLRGRGPIEVGERVRGEGGLAEVWRTQAPEGSRESDVVIVRPSLLASALLVPRGAVLRVHRGIAPDPGYAWFDHEARVNAWAEGPTPAAFPAIAPAERLDFTLLLRVDRLLWQELERAKDRPGARRAVTSLRRVLGLRAVRLLRSPVGFPYFYDAPVEPSDAAARPSRELSGRRAYLLTGANPLTVRVEGPRLLHVFSHGVRREEDQAVELRVFEGPRQRALSAGGAPKTAVTVGPERADTTPLRRAVVHVPPGEHTYRVEAKGGEAFVSLESAAPVVHLGDAFTGIKDERLQLAAARASCGEAKALCALARALAGDDRSDDYQQLLSGLDDEARALAAALAEGAPHDPTVALELAAARGQDEALAALGGAALRLVDDTVRAAWLRGTLRGTRWVVAEAGGETRWLSLLYDDHPACERAPEDPWNEIGKQETTFTTTRYRGAPALELVAAAGCSDQAKVRLAIDGTSIAANPSASLSRWHVLVREARARVRRLDDGDGRVFAIKPEAAACGAHFGFIGAPRLASRRPALSFEPGVTAPGLEVWLRDGSPRAEVTVVGGGAGERAVVVALPREGFVAVDANGARWVRVARVALPAWAASGATVIGGDEVAVRAIVRAPERRTDAGEPTFDAETGAGAGAEADPLDEARLIEASRAIVAADDAVTLGRRYLARAQLLARGAEARAALEDARAAEALGAKGPGGEEPVAWVRANLRPRPKRLLALPDGVNAYGLEPDFDDTAARCRPSVAPNAGPRARLAAVIDELRPRAIPALTSMPAMTPDAPTSPTLWDPALAVRAYQAVEANALDPRGPSVLSRALSGSRWEVARALPDLLKVQRPHRQPKEGVIDPDGDLRPRVGTGQPFERASYATVTESRPARLSLTGVAGAKSRLEFACVARSPAAVVKTQARCPLFVQLGEGPHLRAASGADGRGSFDLPPDKNVTIGLEPAPGRWAALARLVFDREVAGSTHVEGLGWVLLPPGLQWRWLLKADQDVVHKLDGPGLVRVDAVAEPDESVKVVATVTEPDAAGARESNVPLDATPVVLSLPRGGVVRVRAIGGAATIAVAERVGRPQAGADDPEAEPVLAEAIQPAAPPAPATSRALLDGSDPRAPWADTAARAERPLSPLEDALGTLAVHGLARSGTLREGDPSLAHRDGYLEQSVAYRRRLESIGLWGGVSGIFRQHEERASSFGATAFVWTHVPAARLRFAGFADVYGQRIDGFEGRTVHPRAYAEWSGRVTPGFYLLPRVGYDGFYTNIESRPASLASIDDDVFNDFRYRRPTVFYQQLMAWWVPYINDILFLRARVTEDVRHGLSHVGARPGALFAFGDLEVGAWADTTWYRATEGLTKTSKIDVTGVAYALLNLWASAGSLDLQPGVGGRVRADDGGYEVWVLMNVIGSFRRGLRDFASPELAFPEQLGGNVPWRGPAVGGLR